MFDLNENNITHICWKIGSRSYSCRSVLSLWKCQKNAKLTMHKLSNVIFVSGWLTTSAKQGGRATNLHARASSGHISTTTYYGAERTQIELILLGHKEKSTYPPHYENATTATKCVHSFRLNFFVYVPVPSLCSVTHRCIPIILVYSFNIYIGISAV